MTFAHTSVSLGDDSYVQLLRDYLHDRLGLKREVAADEALVSRIIAAAEGRFVYVSFLADRFIAMGRERVEPELAAATEGARSAEALYGLWLAQLDRNFGRKEADRIRQVLCVLAAAELAHGWVFGEGARPDPVDGTPLTMLSEEFAGLPLEVLATVLDSDVIDKIIKDEDGNLLYRQRMFDPVLLFTLERIQGVLRTSRGDAGGRRFRIGLKGLAEVMLYDEELKAGIARAQANLASHALDLVDRLLAEDAAEKPEPLDRELIMALLPFAEAAVQLSGSELLVKRFDTDRVIEVLWQEHQRSAVEGRLSLCIVLHSLMAALEWQPRDADFFDLAKAVQNAVAASLQNRGIAKKNMAALVDATADFDAAVSIMQAVREVLEPVGDWSTSLRNDLAGLLQNRGNAKMDGGALAEAIADYDVATAIRQGLREALEPVGEWSIPLQNDLAAVLQNRGVAKYQGGALAEAIGDFDAAIGITQTLRETLEPVGDWSIPLRNELAGSLQNRGNAKMDGGALAEAIVDYDSAIAIRQDLREALEPVGDWSTPLRNDLAGLLQNRANAKMYGGALAQAIADYDAAIAIKQDLREALEPVSEWSIPLRNDLAGVLQNRGNAMLRGGALAEAIGDFDAAIGIRQTVRKTLEPVGNWSVPLRNELAGSLQNRGNAKMDGGALAEAIVDYNSAIAIREDLREALEPVGDWSITLRNDLALSFQNRGNAMQRGGRLVDAIADYDAAIAIMQDLRETLEPVGDWSIPLRNYLAGLLQNRGVAMYQGGALVAAIGNFDAAIAIRQSLREALEPVGDWSIPLRNELATSLLNRGNTKMEGGALAEAIGDYDAAIAIRQGLREALEPVGDWSHPLRNDLAEVLQNRGIAKAQSGALAEAIGNFDAALAIRQGLREALEPACNWPIPLRNQLAQSLVNRHIILEKAKRHSEAKVDLAAAIAIMADVIALAGENAPNAWQENLKQWTQWLGKMTRSTPTSPGFLQRIFKGRSDGN